MDRKTIIAKALSVLERELGLNTRVFIELLTRRYEPDGFTGKKKLIHGVDNLQDICSPMKINRILKEVRIQYLSLGYDWDALERDLTVRKYTEQELAEKRRTREENRERYAVKSPWNDSEYRTKGT